MSSYKYLLKFIVIGDTGVGKSCLVLRFTEDKMRYDHEVTIGIQFGSKYIKIDDDVLKLQLWDTAGQENFKSITRSYYKSAAGAILTYDITDYQSFLNVETWLNDLRNNCPEQIQIILVGNKSDIEEKRQISYDQGKELAEKHQIMFIESSAKTGDNCEQLFMNLAKEIHKQIEQGTIRISDNVGIKIGSDYYNKKGKKSFSQDRGEEKETTKKSGKCC